MSIPKVAIVGRPNVGKSSIFNWLARRRLAIVDDFEGVTRDRMTTLIEHDEGYFELIDTGGMGVDDADNLTADVRAQIEAAIDVADVFLFVVDVRTGLMPLDETVAERLRGVDRPVILVANKADHDRLDMGAEEFHRLGRGHLICTSAEQRRNREELMQLIVDRLPPSTDEDVSDSHMKFAIVGRRNVGKSTFVNSLAQAKRMIVSEIPGTTRDSVDVNFELDGLKFMAIDTPGLRRRRSVRTDLDFYGMHRAQRSIRRADVTMMFFDSGEKISKVDKQLIGYITEEYKPCIMVVNKWDKYHGQMPTDRWVRYLRSQFSTIQYAPIAFITGQEGKNVKSLLNHAQMLFKQSKERATTGRLNRILKVALDHHAPPLHQNKRPKIYYATQVSTQPPTIVVMCNNPKGFPPDYRRYLLGVLRDNLPYSEVPIKMFIQKREQRDQNAPEDMIEQD